jgi:transposase
MTTIDYIGFDIHKKTISFCAKAQDGRILDEGTIAAQRGDLKAWAKERPRPWVGAMEATLFTGWIYDYLKPLAQELKVAHPPMLKAIAASKKKNDQVDARKIADLLRCDLLPECYMAPSPVRAMRRVLRYRNLVVRQATRMKNRIAGLLRRTTGADFQAAQQTFADDPDRGRQARPALQPAASGGARARAAARESQSGDAGGGTQGGGVFDGRG